MKDEMVIMKVMKSKKVTILSPVCSCSSINTGKKNGKTKTVKKSKSIHIYNNFMGGEITVKTIFRI